MMDIWNIKRNNERNILFQDSEKNSFICII